MCLIRAAFRQITFLKSYLNIESDDVLYPAAIIKDFGNDIYRGRTSFAD